MYIYNENITIKDTKGKVIFWDIDGTLAAYRFNDHVADPTSNEQRGLAPDEIANGLYLNKTPSKHMQHVINTCQAKQHIIISHCQAKKLEEDKIVWLKKHFPTIKEMLFPYFTESKFKVILDYCKTHKIKTSNVLLIDDDHRTLREAERGGIRVYHISSFLDWDYENKF